MPDPYNRDLMVRAPLWLILLLILAIVGLGVYAYFTTPLPFGLSSVIQTPGGGLAALSGARKAARRPEYLHLAPDHFPATSGHAAVHRALGHGREHGAVDHRAMARRRAAPGGSSR